MLSSPLQQKIHQAKIIVQVNDLGYLTLAYRWTNMFYSHDTQGHLWSKFIIFASVKECLTPTSLPSLVKYLRKRPRAYPRRKLLVGSTLRQTLALLAKKQTRLERLASHKHSSSLVTFVNYDQKKPNNIFPRSQT